MCVSVQFCKVTVQSHALPRIVADVSTLLKASGPSVSHSIEIGTEYAQVANHGSVKRFIHVNAESLIYFTTDGPELHLSYAGRQI